MPFSKTFWMEMTPSATARRGFRAAVGSIVSSVTGGSNASASATTSPAVAGGGGGRRYKPLLLPNLRCLVVDVHEYLRPPRLKITISQHTTRVYSVHHIYKTYAVAKAAVAVVEIKQGVLDFIEYTNGQTAPTVFVRQLDGDPDENLNEEAVNETNAASKEVAIDATVVNVTLKKYQILLDAMTLHAFINSLPKPFPETPGLKPTGEGNLVGWLNAAAQSARGPLHGPIYPTLNYHIRMSGPL